MNYLKIILVIVLTTMVIIGCSKQMETTVVNEQTDTAEAVSDVIPIATTITPEDALKLFEQETVILIDVRTPEEFQTGHIKDSINIPLDSLKDAIGDQVPELSQTIVLYCRSGNRSGQASIILKEMGYQTLYDLGGIIDWPYEIVTE